MPWNQHNIWFERENIRLWSTVGKADKTTELFPEQWLQNN